MEQKSREPTSHPFISCWYRWWLKSCTTWDVWNPKNNGIDYLSTGAGFQPSTVPTFLIFFLHQKQNIKQNIKQKKSWTMNFISGFFGILSTYKPTNQINMGLEFSEKGSLMLIRHPAKELVTKTNVWHLWKWGLPGRFRTWKPIHFWGHYTPEICYMESKNHLLEKEDHFPNLH